MGKSEYKAQETLLALPGDTNTLQTELINLAMRKRINSRKRFMADAYGQDSQLTGEHP